MAFLDNQGLEIVWSLILEQLGDKASKEALESLQNSLKNFTKEELNNLGITESNILSGTAPDAGAVSKKINDLDNILTQAIASDSGKSIRTIANEELAAQLIPESAQDKLDTLQEIANWIQQHPEDAAALNNAIETLKGRVDAHDSALETKVPTTRKVNNKALSADISLTASDVGALAVNETAASASKVNNNLIVKLNSGSTEGTNLFTFNGSAAKTINVTPSAISAVPTSRTINSKALTSDITLSAADVSAVPTTRKINNKALSADISLTAADVGAVNINGDTMTGTLTVPLVRIRTSSGWSTLSLQTTDGVALGAVSSLPDGGLALAQFVKGETKNEWFMLPEPTSGLTEDVWYGLLTTKNPVKISQGGTGATDAVTARTNLGITPANIGAVNIAGDTMTGNLTVSGSVVTIGSSWPSFHFKSDANTNTGAVYQSISSRRVGLQQYAVDSEYSEDYLLPTPEVQTARKWYNILTTKNPVTIAQGGTGATDATTARSNLGITPENIGAVSKSGDTMTGALYRQGSSGAIGLAIGTASMPECVSIISVSDGTEFNRFAFRQYGSNGKRENFNLPQTTAPTANVNYQILTSKSAVTVAQGGTGATTAADALTNLGVIYSSTQPTYVAGRIWLKPV